MLDLSFGTFFAGAKTQVILGGPCGFVSRRERSILAKVTQKMKEWEKSSESARCHAKLLLIM